MPLESVIELPLQYSVVSLVFIEPGERLPVFDWWRLSMSTSCCYLQSQISKWKRKKKEWLNQWNVIILIYWIKKDKGVTNATETSFGYVNPCGLHVWLLSSTQQCWLDTEHVILTGTDSHEQALIPSETKWSFSAHSGCGSSLNSMSWLMSSGGSNAYNVHFNNIKYVLNTKLISHQQSKFWPEACQIWNGNSLRYTCTNGKHNKPKSSETTNVTFNIQSYLFPLLNKI